MFGNDDVSVYIAVRILLALPVPDVSIIVSGDSIAGQSYALQCSASVVDSVVVQPDMEIDRPNGSVLVSVEQSRTLTHNFFPLVASDGGQYTCTATVNIPEAGITNLQGIAVETIIVVGMLIFILMHNLFRFVDTCTYMAVMQLLIQWKCLKLWKAISHLCVSLGRLPAFVLILLLATH